MYTLITIVLKMNEYNNVSKLVLFFLIKVILVGIQNSSKYSYIQ